MTEYRKFGVDLSTWQEGVNYKKAVQQGGVEFAVLRASFGWMPGQKDNMFETHYNGFRALALPLGAYHYSYATNTSEAKREADFFLACIKGKTFELPCYIDIEDKCQQSLNRSTLTEIAKTWCREVEMAGYKAGIYTGVYWIRDRMDASALFPKYELWIASWGSKRPTEYDCQMWQFGGTTNLLRSKTVPGIIGTVDQNYLYQDYINGQTSKLEPVLNTCSVTGDYVNLREEAHTEAKVLAVLRKNTEVEWVADDGWGWSKVKAPAATGWMSNLYLSRPSLSRYKTGRCNGTAVNVRRAPALDSTVIRQINPGTTFTVIAILPNGWLHVEIDGVEAYVFYDSSYLQL